tara:strand:- start:49 stop:288 length:240 start_codon:yes stop_codon:yes gene_type:complete
MTFLAATGIIAVCFILSGIGILFFGRQDIGGDCHKAPEDRDGGCISKDIGLCPLEDPDNYLQMASMTSQLKHAKKISKK